MSKTIVMFQIDTFIYANIPSTVGYKKYHKLNYFINLFIIISFIYYEA